MAAFIAVNDISKSYKVSKTGNALVLDGISFSVIQGNITGILGKSGCGKSTLLRIIAGLLQPDHGHCIIDTIDVQNYLRERGIGFVFQKTTLLPWLNLLDNVLFPLTIIKKNKVFELKNASITEEDRIKALNLLEKFGIKDYQKYYPHELSGGMLQRASVARAFIFDPKILLLDEPFNAIDEHTREGLWVDLRRFWKAEGVTVVLVTHSVREAIFMADQVHVLTSRPAKILDTIDIYLPETRGKEIIVDQTFMQLEKKIRITNELGK